MLADVTEEDWAAIPEVGDSRNKSKRNPRGEVYEFYYIIIINYSQMMIKKFYE